jgi:RNA polymerase sigma-70 factor (ECF subfamily)
MTLSDEEIIERIRAGDVDCLGEYLARRRSDLTTFILGKMGPALRQKIEADDIYQEVCTSALQSADQIDFSEYNLFGWLCQLAKRRIVDAQRKFASQKRATNREVGLYSSPAEASRAGLINLLVASITSPSEAFSRQQREFKLLQALSQLPEQQQLALRLRYVDDLPSKQVAGQIGKSDGATRVLIARAIKRLEIIMTEMESHQDD